MTEHTIDMTVTEVAAELRMTTDGVYKLIQRGHLHAERLSERKTYVRRQALDEFLEARKHRVKDIRNGMQRRDSADLRAEFFDTTGSTPEEWLAAWKAEEVDDTPENARVLVRAVALRRRPDNKTLIEDRPTAVWATAAFRMGR